MKNLKLIVAALLIISSASAQEVAQTPSKDPALIYPISKGQVAPFPGVLLTPAASVAVIAEYSLFNERLKLEVDTALAIERAKFEFNLREQESKCTLDKSTLEARVQSTNDKMKIFEENLAASEAEVARLKEEMPSRLTWFGVGAVSGIVFTVATAYAIGQLVN
jgi:hypothetical protein